MWLLNVKTRRLEEFLGLKIPNYAILSHTWEAGQEITFQELLVPLDPESAAKRGWWKIDQTCRQAEHDGLDYAWIDTCCIDKLSSAILSEAINSMFHWYQRASVCYVYLEDLLQPGSAAGTRSCRWFTRAWTLQELIAPRHVQFYTRDWIFCFTKSQEAAELSSITRINLAVLNHETSLSAISIAQKMSWANSREATRIEDTAYSLLGIFDINMPLLYGEEEKAFMRLQSEIIRSSPDPSILAWIASGNHERDGEMTNVFTGVLASSPNSFGGCGDFRILPSRLIPKFSVSNLGINVRAKFGLANISTKPTLSLPVCQSSGHTLAIAVRNLGGGMFVREHSAALVSIQPDSLSSGLMLNPTLLMQLSPLILAKARTGWNLVRESRQCALQIVRDHTMQISRQWPWTQWDEPDGLFFGPENPNLGWAALKIEASLSDVFPVHQGSFSFDFLLFIFGWAKPQSRTARFTIHQVDETLSEQALENMNDKAVNEDWDTYWVVKHLVKSHVPEHSSIVVCSEGDWTLLLSCNIGMVEENDVCAHPFWRLKLDLCVVPRDEVPDIVDRRWKQMDWKPHWRVPWNDKT
ncbi:HET-domain-containing protein [Xylariaceae sp. FL0255]|nr:HET-domain-containing protein [Xylariaceae sp. FL0255]